MAFMFALITAGMHLWKLDRRGLRILVYTLLAELIYLIGIATVSMAFHNSNALGRNVGAMAGVGNLALGLQIVTGFPIVAGILVFFAYRYLSIPAQPL